MLFLLLGLAALLGGGTLLAFAWRRVVETNTVHIVQSRTQTRSYGSGQEGGNVYYAIPSFIPVFGVTVIDLPVNNFSCNLHAYKAYDKDRVPFELDVTAFFRIADTNKAAQRISHYNDLTKQLEAVVQGAVRKILASHDVNSIMVDRATFGEQFTNEVKGELANWGVEPVKNLELMDIRDADGSEVIRNIMAKKTSHIAMESRIEVAQNNQRAKEAEIAAVQAVDLKTQDANLAVGQRTADVAKDVGISQEKAKQAVQEEAATTMTKHMAVRSVETQRSAEIEAAATVTKAQGELTATQLDATGIQATGAAAAEAKRLAEMATVTPQLELAKGTTGNKDYQDYLVRVAEVAANRDVGIAQANALGNADIKIIANSDGIASGLDGARGLLTSRTGQGLGAILEGLKNTPEGAALLSRFTGGELSNGHGLSQ